MDSKPFYLTTTLPYVNADPHIGHTLEFVQADVIARYMRENGLDVFFNVGTDEHGLKIFRKAEEQGKKPQEYVDFFAQRFKDFCQKFDISYDRFIRTTDEDHVETAKKFWQKSLENGDIYKKKYEGLYCVGCEEFKTEKDLVNGICPDHGKAPEKFSEENYFFKFSKYQKPLLEIYEKNKVFIKPESKLTEMVKFVSRGLDDFSISRKKQNLPWGIPVPGDDEQVMYVWFDALVNYVACIGWGSDEEKFAKWWPVVQLCGPDNTRFQSAMWQAMLLSAGIKPSKQILVHGMVLAEDGRKMSKTLQNVISPFDILDKYGLEAVRYYLISGIPTFGDSSFKIDELEAKYNSDLRNNFGNLLNRVITLLKKLEVKKDSSLIDQDFGIRIDQQKRYFDKLMGEFEMFEAMKIAQELGNMGNIYITEKEPWGKGKTKDEVSVVLNNLVYLLEVLIYFYTPVIPQACQRAKEALEKIENIILFQPLEVK